MSKVAIYLWLSTSILLGLQGCTTILKLPHEDIVGNDFFQLDRSDRRQRFQRLTPDQQLDVYLYGMNELHPPVMGLASEFAGSAIFMETGFVVRLHRSNDVNAVHLALLLKTLVCKQDAAIRVGFALSMALLDRVELLQDKEDKRFAQKMISQIGHCKVTSVQWGPFNNNAQAGVRSITTHKPGSGLSP